MEWVDGESPDDLNSVSTGSVVDHASAYLERQQVDAKKPLIDLVLGQIWSVALKYHFRMPPYYTLVLRSLASLEAYEKIRQRRIEGNNLKMAELEIKKATSQVSQLNKSSKKVNNKMHPKGNSKNDTDEYTPAENAELNSSNDENEIVANKVKLRSSNDENEIVGSRR